MCPNLKRCVQYSKRCIPNLKRCIPNLKRCVPNLKRSVPNLKRCVPNLNRCDPNLKRCVQNLKRCVQNLKRCVQKLDLFLVSPGLLVRKSPKKKPAFTNAHSCKYLCNQLFQYFEPPTFNLGRSWLSYMAMICFASREKHQIS